MRILQYGEIYYNDSDKLHAPIKLIRDKDISSPFIRQAINRHHETGIHDRQSVQYMCFIVVWYRPTLDISLIIPPLQRSWKGGILVSPCPSVRLSVCGQNRVRSISSTIFVGSIWYLHRFKFRFKRFIQGNDTYWQATPCLPLVQYMSIEGKRSNPQHPEWS